MVGCALAHELSRYRVRTILIDRNTDVGEGTSKANSAIIHTGFDASPDTLESKLVTSASHLWPELAARLKIPLLQTGAIVLAVDDEQARSLETIYRKALDNGVADVEIVDAKTAKELEPHVTPRVLGGLLVPRESVIDSFGVSIGFAEVALANGVDVLLGCGVTAIDECDQAVKTIRGENDTLIRSKLVLNVAGLGSREIADMYGGGTFDINPRRGQFLLYDTQCRNLANRILLPIPTKTTKGKLVAPTIFGNILTGPTAEDMPLHERFDTGTTAAGLEEVAEGAARLCPEVIHQPLVAAFAGQRCNCSQGSYLIRCNDGHPGIVTVTGVRSTGLTTSPTLATHLIEEMVSHCGLELIAKEKVVHERPESSWPGWWRRPYDTPATVSSRPECGQVLCSCEQITRGEIIDALNSPLRPCSLDALKRRTRALTGRCQGFNCLAPIARTVSHHLQIPIEGVTKNGPGSEIISPGPATSPPVVTLTEPAPSPEIPDHVRVAIIGAGPAGIGIAIGLARRGVEPVILLERADTLGGTPSRYVAKKGGVPTFTIARRGQLMYGRQYVDRLTRVLQRTSTLCVLNTQILDVEPDSKSLTLVNPRTGKQTISADAIVFACGSREQNRAERGWIQGSRPAGILHTMNLLDLLDGDNVLPLAKPAIIGSDLVAWSAAAKMKAAGAGQTSLLDRYRRPETPFLARLYFSRWCRPTWHGAIQAATIRGPDQVTGIEIKPGTIIDCDGIVLSGLLVPNSELIVSAGLGVEGPHRIPRIGPDQAMTAPGLFSAGNVVGGFHSADWCYRHGMKLSRSVAAFLRQ